MVIVRIHNPLSLGGGRDCVMKLTIGQAQLISVPHFTLTARNDACNTARYRILPKKVPNGIPFRYSVSTPCCWDSVKVRTQCTPACSAPPYPPTKTPWA